MDDEIEKIKKTVNVVRKANGGGKIAINKIE